MAQELKVFTINMKSLDQDISDPVVVGGGEAYGRTLRVVFTQEAAAQFSEYTKVYLKWYNQDAKISGYNVFEHVSDKPPVWEIKYPRTMLFEGDVLACIELVDDISIAASTNFHIHVLADPNDGSNFLRSEDYSVFQEAVLDMNSAVDKAYEQLEEQQLEFEEMKEIVRKSDKRSKCAYKLADKTYKLLPRWRDFGYIETETDNWDCNC